MLSDESALYLFRHGFEERNLKTGTPEYRPHEQGGFSLIEASVSFCLLMVLAGFALMNLDSIMPRMGANTAMKQTLAQLRTGRESAIAQRRNVQLQFIGTNQIQIVRQEVPNGTTVLSTLTLQNGDQFQLFGGLPDTPDAFGNTAAISFGGPAPWTFLSDGTLVDSTSNPVNGTVFLGQPNSPNTARAVTVLGATGRVRDYTWSGTEWFH